MNSRVEDIIPLRPLIGLGDGKRTVWVIMSIASVCGRCCHLLHLVISFFTRVLGGGPHESQFRNETPTR